MACFPVWPVDCVKGYALTPREVRLKKEKLGMHNAVLKLYVKSRVLWNTLKQEEGQDLVEYAAVIMIVVLGLVSGMNTLANGINSVMGTVTSQINSRL
jgi:Flp pilus assembly pilin Flp